MTVQLDDWSLSGLSGAMDWTILLPPGASTGSAGASPLPPSLSEQTHNYLALYTELTPSVLTGYESAEAAAAGVPPLVYARLSSIASVEKVGPRQLRLRQQLGWPGSYRLIFLTASSEAVCDDWWRALHRLTYNNSNEDVSFRSNNSNNANNNYTAYDDTYNTAMSANGADANLNGATSSSVLRAQNPGIVNEIPWQSHQQPQQELQQGRPRISVVRSEVTPWARTPTAAAATPSQSSALPSPMHEYNDVAQLRRALLSSPTPDAGSTSTGRPAMHLSPPPPLTSDRVAALLSAHAPNSAESAAPPPPPLREDLPQFRPSSLPASGPVAAAPSSLNASTIDTSTATPLSAREKTATATAPIAPPPPQEEPFHPTTTRLIRAVTGATSTADVVDAHPQQRHPHYRHRHSHRGSHASSSASSAVPFACGGARACDRGDDAPVRAADVENVKPLSSPPSSQQLRQSLPPPPPLVKPRATRSEASQTTSTPIASVPVGRGKKAVVAPTFDALLQGAAEDVHPEMGEAERRHDHATPKAEDSSNAALAESTVHALPRRAEGGARTTWMLSPLKDVPPRTKETGSPLDGADPVEVQPSILLRPGEDTRVVNVAAAAAGAVPSRKPPVQPSAPFDQQRQPPYPAPAEPQQDTQHPLAPLPAVASPPPSPPSPSLPAWKSTRALMAAPVEAALTTTTTSATLLSTPALDPTLYEPIHTDSAFVPRARSASPPTARLQRLPPPSFADAYAAPPPLSWRGAITTSPRTPRLLYGSSSISALLPRSPRHRQQSSHSVKESPRNRRGDAQKQDQHPLQHRSRSRSPHASTAKPHSRSASPLIHRSSSLTVSPLLAIIARPHLFLKYPVQAPAPRSARNSGTNRTGGRASASDGVATYVFVTTDEACVVTVPAGHFKRCVEDANLLQDRSSSRHAQHRSRSTSPFAAATMSIAVRSYERAKKFFGAEHCRAMHVADVDRVTRGNEEPLILLNTTQRERFRDPAKLICVVAHTHAFFMEATNSTEAEWYVRSWKKFLRARHGPHKKPHHGGYY